MLRTVNMWMLNPFQQAVRTTQGSSDLHLKAKIQLTNECAIRAQRNAMAASQLITKALGVAVFFTIACTSNSQSTSHLSEMTWVQGGKLPKESDLSGDTVSDFAIAKFEVTLSEWKSVCTWGMDHGYDLDSVGSALGELHPVCHVSWYDALKWCNARSEVEGLTPVYGVVGKVYRRGSFGSGGSVSVTRWQNADGYRLPSDAEWEGAARGGIRSMGFLYSGGNTLSLLGWYRGNCFPTGEHLIGIGTRPVGNKLPNELGLYDMSGNVWEWCWDSFSIMNTSERRIRGGCWFTGDGVARVSYRDASLPPDARYGNCGFRVARRAS